MEFKLTYYEVTVQLFSCYVMGTSVKETRIKCQPWKPNESDMPALRTTQINIFIVVVVNFEKSH